MGILGDLNRYTQFQAANAVEAAAENPGGAGEGVGLGMGMAMGQRMAQSLGQRDSGSTGQAAAQQPPEQPSAGPPPLPPQAEWFVGAGGQQQGPFDADALAAQARAGTLTPTTLVWKSGMPAWAPAHEVPEVAAVLQAAPPPLPPS
jgi:membrane protease subunit (stomatin/prohibitin family)